MEKLSTWVPSPDEIEWDDSSLHIWRVALRAPEEAVDAAYRALIRGEQLRADRFRMERGRRSYVLMRAALRGILARYTEHAPQDLAIQFEAYGKPVLANAPLHFNLSHSGDFGLIAVTRQNLVGVDLEQINTRRATLEIAQRFFSESENRELSRYDERDKPLAFFRCWSRKEAVIKALGEGLACPLNSFDVSLDEDRADLLALRRDDAAPGEWNMLHIDVEPGYAAAAAVIGACRDVHGYRYS